MPPSGTSEHGDTSTHSATAAQASTPPWPPRRDAYPSPHRLGHFVRAVGITRVTEASTDRRPAMNSSSDCRVCQGAPASWWRRLLPGSPRHCSVCHAVYRGAHCGRCHRTFRDLASLDAHVVGRVGQPPPLSLQLAQSIEPPRCLDPMTSTNKQHPGRHECRSLRNKWGTDEYQLLGYVAVDDGLPCVGCGHGRERSSWWAERPTHCPQCHATSSTHCKHCHLSFHCGECYAAHRGDGEIGTVCFTPATLAAMSWRDRVRRDVRALPRTQDEPLGDALLPRAVPRTG